jgi:hypothetical protein
VRLSYGIFQNSCQADFCRRTAAYLVRRIDAGSAKFHRVGLSRNVPESFYDDKVGIYRANAVIPIQQS